MNDIEDQLNEILKDAQEKARADGLTLKTPPARAKAAPMAPPAEAILPWRQQIRAIFKRDDLLHFKFIHGTNVWTDDNGRDHPCTQESWLLNDGNDSDLGEQLIELEQDGWNIFVCIAVFDLDKIKAAYKASSEGEYTPKRVPDNIAMFGGKNVVRAVAIDCDKDGEASLRAIREAVAAGIVPAPTLIIQSSTPAPNDEDGIAKYHVWWAVDGFTLEQQAGMNSALQRAFGGDVAARDVVRVLRLAGFQNQKPKYTHKPVAKIIEINDERYIPEQFHLPMVVEETTERVKTSDAHIEYYAAQIEENAEKAGFDLGDAKAWQGTGVQWLQPECPNSGAHTDGGKDGSCVRIMATGAREFSCLHGHCRENNEQEGSTKLDWSWFKNHLDELAGEKLDWSTKGMLVTHDEVNAPTVAAAADSVTENEQQEQQEQQEQDVRDFAELQKQVESAAATNWAIYPADAWDGTLYMDFAQTCKAGGGMPNHIPLEYFINALMTAVGAIAGHRIVPEFNDSIHARFYTTMISTFGGVGKGTTLTWVDELFEPSRLIQVTGLSAYRNIGTHETSFASGPGALGFMKSHHNVFQVYEEVSTLLEKYSISGSGDQLKNINLELADSTRVKPSLTKTAFKGELPPKVYNSILGATTLGRWEEWTSRVSLETMIQRSNIILTTETRTVPSLGKPNFDEIREQLFARLAVLEQRKLVWKADEDGANLISEWHASLQASDDEDVKEAMGRIQVHLHRIIGHLAFCLAPLPEGVITDLSSLEHAELPEVGTRIEDGVWQVEVNAGLVARAISIAENQMANRTAIMPAQGVGILAQVENLIRKYVATVNAQSWQSIRRRLRRFDNKTVESAFSSLRKEGVLRIVCDPEDQDNRARWTVVRARKPGWKERRGGIQENIYDKQHAGKGGMTDEECKKARENGTW